MPQDVHQARNGRWRSGSGRKAHHRTRAEAERSARHRRLQQAADAGVKRT